MTSQIIKAGAVVLAGLIGFSMLSGKVKDGSGESSGGSFGGESKKEQAEPISINFPEINLDKLGLSSNDEPFIPITKKDSSAQQTQQYYPLTSPTGSNFASFMLAKTMTPFAKTYPKKTLPKHESISGVSRQRTVSGYQSLKSSDVAKLQTQQYYKL